MIIRQYPSAIYLVSDLRRREPLGLMARKPFKNRLFFRSKEKVDA